MDTHYIRCVANFIKDLIPNCSINFEKIKGDLSPVFENSKCIVCNNGKKASFEIEDKKFLIYLQSISGEYTHKITVSRTNIQFSKIELKMLILIPKAIRSTNIMSKEEKIYQPQIIEAECAFEYFVISQIMRGTNQSRWGAPIHYLRLLQELTYQKYETNNCTSGFVCVKNTDQFLCDMKKTDKYKFIKFDKPIRIYNGFFDKPASYRYVDGRNSFYLCTRNENVEGIIYFKYPQEYSIIDRCVGSHIEELLSLNCCKWISYVGYSQDVVLFARYYSQIKWEKNKWHLREKEQIERILIERMLCENDFAHSITKVIFTLSELHMGSLILITQDKAPSVKGKIDNTLLGVSLYQAIKDMGYKELIKSNRILGLLSSDGLTVFNKNGDVIDCGSIIDLSGGNGQVTGGGRTQAASIASNYGISIKISEDGPISVFEKGSCILSL